VLGSCVATCLFDPEEEVGGMNHFLLAEPPASVAPGDFDEHYGVYLMEMLINEMLANGAAKSRLRAHLYGGANLNSGWRGSARKMPFARSFWPANASPSCARMGGNHARRVDFRPARGQVRCRTAENTLVPKPAHLRPSVARRCRTVPDCESEQTDEQTTRILTVDDSASMRALTNCAADQPGLQRGAGRGWRGRAGMAGHE
jgi:chemotaxis protein CheD